LRKSSTAEPIRRNPDYGDVDSRVCSLTDCRGDLVACRSGDYPALHDDGVFIIVSEYVADRPDGRLNVARVDDPVVVRRGRSVSSVMSVFRTRS